MGILSDILNDAPGVKPLGTVSHMERCLASDRWITIHPHGDEENYRRIEIDDDGTILRKAAQWRCRELISGTSERTWLIKSVFAA